MKFLRVLLPLCFISSFAAIVSAEQLPIKNYTTADGLAHDGINCIVQDSHGFLWFCTSEGLSRFDGYKFTNYGTAHGLPHRIITALLETRSGAYWIATGNGIARFNPSGVPRTRSNAQAGAQPPAPAAAGGTAAIPEPMFATYRVGDNEAAQPINVLIEDHAGTVWCGTEGGLY